jgi:hypothetical protein
MTQPGIDHVLRRYVGSAALYARGGVAETHLREPHIRPQSVEHREGYECSDLTPPLVLEFRGSDWLHLLAIGLTRSIDWYPQEKACHDPACVMGSMLLLNDSLQAYYDGIITFVPRMTSMLYPDIFSDRVESDMYPAA